MLTLAVSATSRLLSMHRVEQADPGPGPGLADPEDSQLLGTYVSSSGLVIDPVANS